MRIVAINAARFDAVKHLALPVVGDAREALGELEPAGRGVGGARVVGRSGRAPRRPTTASWSRRRRRAATVPGLPTYAQVIGAVNRLATEHDYVVAAAGGLPGELNVNWLARGVGTFDCEYGFSCMGYEIAGGWGARMARREGEVVVFVGDGSYLMMNSDLYSSVLCGHRLIVIVCDNGGFAVIDRLQVDQGGASFANLHRRQPHRTARAPSTSPPTRRRWGASPRPWRRPASWRRRSSEPAGADRTTVIVLRTDPHAWTPGGAFWEVGVPAVSDRPRGATGAVPLDEGKSTQRVGW